jgi:hypothetical protein
LEGWAVEFKGNSTAPNSRATCALKRMPMILPVSANLKEIVEKGRKYPWSRPEVCLCCLQSHVWGHGFVEALFDGYAEALLLRRYRCPVCGCVIKLRPKAYFRRFQASKGTIRSHIVARLQEGKWPRGCSSARCRHWLRALKRQAMAYLGMQWLRHLVEAFDRLVSMGKVPVSRCI